MKMVCAPDSYKESLSAAEAAAAMERGVRGAVPDAEVVCVPLSDGGEGFLDAVHAAAGGQMRPVTARDPLGRPIRSRILHLAEQDVAVVELAAAAGLGLLTPKELNPEVTSTAGVGDLIAAALDLGVSEIVVGLGGSATNDAGTGMLSALGVRFLDAADQPLPPGGAALSHLASIDDAHLDSRLTQVSLVIASDVTNPLLGASGASHIFGPQKGARPEAVERLDQALQRWADVVENHRNTQVRDIPGAGAAGGVAAGLLAFTDAEITSGADHVLDLVGFDELARDASWVLTGEGKWDAQSAGGKAPQMVARRAHAVGISTVIFAGRLEGDHTPPGVKDVIAISQPDDPAALANAATNLETAVATWASQQSRS